MVAADSSIASPDETFGLTRHGDYPVWQDAIDRLPDLRPSVVGLDQDIIRIGKEADCNAAQRALIRQQLMRLLPWRKGPFNLFGVQVDAEWRSDLKWRRLQDEITPLSGRVVLDVGCSNGYYGWRMLGAGAGRVLGVEPTLRYVMQQRAVAKYLPEAPFEMLPVALDALASGAARSATAPSAGFDTIFSMGVIYHQRDPAGHLRQLAGLLSADGELALESLVIEPRYGETLRPDGRYARMPNVRCIPSVDALLTWLRAAGFSRSRVVDESITTPAEQRVTRWTFEQSLADFLDPHNPARTVEGYPAPRRALLIGRR